jgi:hypothetical protein
MEPSMPPAMTGLLVVESGGGIDDDGGGEICPLVLVQCPPVP